MTRVFLFIGLLFTPFTTNQSAKIVQLVSAKSYHGSTYQWQGPPFPPGCTFWVIPHWDKGSGLCTPATTSHWILTALRKWGQNMGKVAPSTEGSSRGGIPMSAASRSWGNEYCGPDMGPTKQHSLQYLEIRGTLLSPPSPLQVSAQLSSYL